MRRRASCFLIADDRRGLTNGDRDRRGRRALEGLDRLERAVKVRPADDPRLLGLIRGAKDAVRAARLGRSLGQIVTILDEPSPKARPGAFVALTENIS